MLTPARLLRRLRALLGARRASHEIEEEMRHHLDMETARLMRDGMDERSARQRALRDFGGVAQHREEAADALGTRAARDFLTDLRIGARSLLRQRTYATVAVLTLAIGIGGVTALGTAVYRVLIAPYPFPEADRIVTLWQSDVRVPGSIQPVAPGNFLDWRERTRTFDLMAAIAPYSFDWVGPDGPTTFQSALVTADFFAIQGLAPLLGRTFLPSEFTDGRDGVVMLTEAAWRSRFGGDSAIVGRTLVLDSIARVVVGVMPEDAMTPYGAEMWAPKVIQPEEPTTRAGGYWQVVARRAPDVTLAQAQADLDVVAAQLATEFPVTNTGVGAAVVTLRDAIGGSARRSLLVLLGAVACVLVIACVNVANLQLGEAIRRRRELAIRTAIGAGHGRITRQLLTECLLVASIGSAAGLFLAWATIAAIRANAPQAMWQLTRLTLDVPAVLLALSLAAVTTLTIGVVPVLAARRFRLADALAAGMRANSSVATRRGANRALAVSEVALALVLLVGAGLLLRSLSELGRSDRGFATDHLLITTVQASNYYATPEARTEYVRNATERLRVVPGVEVVGVTSALPLSWPIGRESAPVAIEGEELPAGGKLPVIHVEALTAGYLDALRIPLRAGRSFVDTDRAGGVPVALVNEAFARRYLAGREALGQRLTLGFAGPSATREVVGIIGDVRREGLDADPLPAIYLPHAQAATGAMHIVTRTSGDPEAMRSAVRAALLELNGAMPLDQVTTMDALVSQSLHARRFQLGLLASFSLTALLLSAIGIYGVMSRAASDRTHEIGVRLAIGAEPREVRWMVLRSGGALAAVGIVAGTGVALVLTRYMSAMLFGVTPLDPLTYLAAGGVLLLAALAATWVPAWRASAVDPMEALRAD